MCVNICLFIIFPTTGIRVKVSIKGGRKTKRLKSNNFTNVVNHYNYNDRFGDEVEDKVKIYETLDKWRIC